jgi:hypothetical protein
MKIDRSNYEIWLIDWLDGNLNDIEAKELKLFLEENPDLKDEAEELNMVSLGARPESYSYKRQLIKTPQNLTNDHVEYLSAAYLEDDLSPDHKRELKEIIESDPEKKRTFELIQKMKLTPVAVAYTHKSRLIRRTLAWKVTRLSVIGLSAAAMIALAILSYYSRPKTLPLKPEIIAKTGTEMSVGEKPADLSNTNKLHSEEITNQPSLKNNNRGIEVIQTALISSGSDITNPLQTDSLFALKNTLSTSPDKIFFSCPVNINKAGIPNTLVASNVRLSIPDFDDGRSKFNKFIARNFRQKILKDTIARDSPLKAYEIAEAGVSGLNKLLGWEMALDKRNDENGELESVYFSSKMLKFNAPVKKTEPLQ